MASTLPGCCTKPVTCVRFSKVTPGIGLLWFLLRREWRSLAIALGTTLAIVVGSFLLAPSAWFDWYSFLRGSTGSGELLYLRMGAATVITTVEG